MSYYYIENALFRISTLWDLVAQFYRLYFQMEIKPNRVHYKNIFYPNSSYSKKFKLKAREIDGYINQKDDIRKKGEWEGNHAFVNECRNKMIHRNSPNISTVSNFDINIKMYPTFMLKRIVEDYSRATQYLSEILETIEKNRTF